MTDKQRVQEMDHHGASKSFAMQSNQMAADTEVERLKTALRRIVSLAEKNVPKYAQHIAKEALSQ